MCSLGSPGLSDIGDRGKKIIYLSPCQVIMIQLCLNYSHCSHEVHSLLGNSSFTYDKVEICEKGYDRDVYKVPE